MSNKRKCVICNKSKTKYVCGKEGEYYNKPVCRKCLKKIVLNDNELMNEYEKYSHRCESRTNLIIYCAIFFLTLGIIGYCKTFTDFNDVIEIFKDNSKIMYFCLFSVVNYISGVLMGYFTQGKKLWVKILLNLLFTIELTLVGCVVVIKQDISWQPKDNPLSYLIPIMIVAYLVVLILNKLKRIDKEKLQYGALSIMLISGAIMVWALIVSGY